MSEETLNEGQAGVAKPTTYVVTVMDIRFVPFLNRSGPISTPVAISAEVYDNLVKLGFNMRVKDTLYTSADGEAAIVSEEDFQERQAGDEVKEQEPEALTNHNYLPEGAIREAAEATEEEKVVSEATPAEAEKEEVAESEFALPEREALDAMTKGELVEWLKTVPTDYLTEEQQKIIRTSTSTREKLNTVVDALYAAAAEA